MEGVNEDMHHGKMYGTTSIGERGQVVIPSDAREELGIEAGDKFVVFGSPNKGSVLLIKSEKFDQLATLFLNKSKEFEEFAKKLTEQSQASEE
ncbi:MAG: AbrB family DNA-binding protein [Bacillales bacterium]|nr:AbrB family DNA-binding protein [Bacillales bacterium]